MKTDLQALSSQARIAGYQTAHPDRYFDPNADWRTVAKSSARPASALRELYESRIRTLIGLEVGRPRTVTIAEKKRALYRLVYASRSKFGIELWEDVARRSRERQDEFHLPGV